MIFVFVHLAAAQDDSCILTVERTISQATSVCKDLPSETVCYGHRSLEMVLSSPEEVIFNTPGDQISLGLIDTIQSFPIDLETLAYGAAVIDTQGASLLIMGDVNFHKESAQTFSFQANSEAAECGEAPSAVVAYTTTPTSFTLNASQLIMNGVVVFQQPFAGSLTAYVQKGTLQIVNGPRATQAQTLDAALLEDGSAVDWTEARPADLTELLAADLVGRLLEGLNFVCESSYLVAEGDTLENIAERYALSIDAVIAANGIEATTSISIGQSLTIPCTTASTSLVPEPTPIPDESVSNACDEQIIHTVAAGENMFRIAQRYHTTIEAISEANGIMNPRLIAVGQQLIIPCEIK